MEAEAEHVPESEEPSSAREPAAHPRHLKEEEDKGDREEARPAQTPHRSQNRQIQIPQISNPSLMQMEKSQSNFLSEEGSNSKAFR